MANCLVIGANGQDGSYLSEILISQGHRVYGIGKQKNSRYVINNVNFSYKDCDIRNNELFRSIIEEFQPDEIYHVAAVHGPYGFFYEDKWDKVLDVNIKSVHAILEYSRQCARPPAIFYASSAKVFGDPLPNFISIDQQLRTDCLYSISKVTAENLLKYYSIKYNINASIGYLFNHESPRRQPEYFIPRIVNILKHSLKDSTYKESIFTLDFYCDWGCAKEYMQMATDMIKKPGLNRCIFATGTQTLARELVKKLFKKYNLDYLNHIDIEHINNNPEKSFIDIEPTKTILGYSPTRTIYDISIDILNNEKITTTSS